MSRFFVQLLLSMVVGVSAAVGLGPQAIKIRQDAKASLHEKIKADLPAFGGVTTQVRTNTSVSAQSQVKSVIKENFKADTKVKSNLNTQVNINTGANTNMEVTVLNDLLPQVSPSGVDSSVAVNAQTKASVNTPVVDLKLKNTIKSDLDLNLLP
jgi:hypothetical protein